MKKSELIAAVSATSKITKGDVEDVLDAFCSVTRDALAKGDKVALPDFGTFITKERAARKGRNPQTGDPIEIPAKTVVALKPTKSLADHLA